MSEMFTKCNGFIVSGDPLVYADSATMTGQGTVSEPFGVKSTDLFVKEPLYTGVSGNSAYIGWNNETILWSGNGPSVATKTQDFVLNESYKNFEQLQIWWGNQPGAGLRGTVITNYPVDDSTNAWQGINACSDYPNHISYKMCFLSAVSDTEFTAYSYRQAAVNTNTTANFVWGTPKQYYECYPLKIIGINRKV